MFVAYYFVIAMESPIIQNLYFNVLFGSIIFLFLSLFLFLLWTSILRFLNSNATKSKNQTILNMLKEINTNISLFIFLISIYTSVAVVDESLLQNKLFKILEIGLLFIGISIVGKIIIVFFQEYCENSAELKVLAGKLSLIKTIVSFFIYTIAIIVIIELINPQIGNAIALFGAIFMIFAFVLFYDQLKNVLAGIQLMGGRIKKGDYIEALGLKGHVLDVRGRRTLIKNKFWNCQCSK